MIFDYLTCECRCPQCFSYKKLKRHGFIKMPQEHEVYSMLLCHSLARPCVLKFLSTVVLESKSGVKDQKEERNILKSYTQLSFFFF